MTVKAGARVNKHDGDYPGAKLGNRRLWKRAEENVEGTKESERVFPRRRSCRDVKSQKSGEDEELA